ncbi:PAS domain S-box family protein [Ichthyophthirius multifiliis]|uniref:PAS domain S-box family protein n=1 Tax=Ichthyophthirius multifiliis TaxID=5932 RepID=G0QLJ3_ICHMU|nr:PAS domain S-box family protein [Ichthyophthirius multifiliis]EGR33913.1 PAS domain S-box family protein [Ichthyophthirius multifiliis]|eukprot:XP_004039217.1 PAS domain S-box family protein [Ichthyophthirius multifiliis]
MEIYKCDSTLVIPTANNCENTRRKITVGDVNFLFIGYKKLIEDDIAESQQDDNTDIVSEMAFQNNLRLLQNGIERCALQLMDFWSQLGEDSPDLGKMNEIGFKISASIQQVEEQWNKMKKITNGIPKAMRLYGKYMIEILNDKEQGEELLQKARVVHNSNNNNRKVTLAAVAQGLQFVGSFRVEKAHRKVSYIYTDPSGHVEHVSASAINFLNIDNKFITQKDVDIDEILPGAFSQKDKYMTKSGENVMYCPPKKENQIQKTPIEMNLMIQEIVFSINPLAGYIFKLEISQPNNNNSNISYNNAQPQKKTNNNNAIVINNPQLFQVSFIPNKFIFYGQFFTSTPEKKVDVSFLMQDENQTYEIQVQNEIQIITEKIDNQQIEKQSSKKNYAIGIKKMRLYYDHIAEVDLEEEKSDSEEEEGDIKKSIFQNQNDEDGDDVNINEFNSSFKSRRALKSVVNDESEPSSVINLKRVVNVLILVLVLIAFLDFFLSNNEFNNIQANIDLVISSNKILNELQSLLSYIRDLKFIKMGILEQKEDWKSIMEQQISSIQNLKKSITFSNLGLSNTHSDLLYNVKINLKSNAGEDTEQSLLDAIGVMAAYAQKIIEPKDFKYEEFYFFEYNMFSVFYEKLIENSNLFIFSLYNRTDLNNSIFIIWMIISGISLFLATLILIPLSIIVNQSKQEILQLFLDIKEKKVKTLYQKCESFVANLQLGEEDDVESSNDLDRQIDDDSESKNKRRKHPCEIIFEQKGANVQQCQQFAEKSVFQGMSIAITRYFENTRYNNYMHINSYIYIYIILEFNAFKYEIIKRIGYKNQKIKDQLTLQLLSLLRLPLAQEIRDMQNIYIKISYRYLTQKFKESLDLNYMASNTQRLALFIVFNILIFVAFFMFWLPLVSKITRSIWRTRGMLIMIPFEVIKSTKSIQKFIRRYLNKYSVSNY